MKKLEYLACLLLLLSCAAAEIKSGDKVKVSFHEEQEHEKEVVIETSIDFFLWGLVPKNYVVSLDEIFVKEGYSSVASLKLEQNLTFKDFLFTAFTLGFYLPQTLTITGKINPYGDN